MRQVVKIGSFVAIAVLCIGLVQQASAQLYRPGMVRPGMGTATATPTANAVPLKLKGAPEGKPAKSPIYKVSVGTQNSSTVTWWQGVVEFETSPEWIDEVEFTFYAFVPANPSAKETEKLYRSTVTYVNVPKGKYVADCFLHPNILKRYGKPEQTAVIVKINGAIVAQASTSATPNWWDRFSPIDGILLNRGQTPFALVDYDLYPTIKMSVPVAR